MITGGGGRRHLPEVVEGTPLHDGKVRAREADEVADGACARGAGRVSRGGGLRRSGSSNSSSSSSSKSSSSRSGSRSKSSGGGGRRRWRQAATAGGDGRRQQKQFDGGTGETVEAVHVKEHVHHEVLSVDLRGPQAVRSLSCGPCIFHS
jgi:hypothetical protein